MPGLAAGWEGFAWAWLQQATADAQSFDPVVLRLIRRRLERELLDPVQQCGHYVGIGGAVLIAYLCAPYDRRIAPLAERLFGTWQSVCENSNNADFMEGHAGAIMTAAEIEGALPGSIPLPFARSLCRKVESAASKWLRSYARGPVPTGFAHGLAGLMLGLESGRAVFGHIPKQGLLSRCLDALEAEALRATDGSAVWTLESRAHYLSRHAWCSGSPGIALALLACYRLTGTRSYRALAAPALTATVRFDNEDVMNICCGVAGRCSILVEAFRITGESEWLTAAKKLAAIHFRGTIDPQWFHQAGYNFGELGVRHALLRIEKPAKWTMPGLGILSVPSYEHA